MPNLFDLKSLDRQDAHLALTVERFCRRDLGLDLRGKYLLLAVSGGADSCAMLVLFRALRAYWNLTLHVAHLDHALRPSSLQEAQLVRDLCAKLEVDLTIQRRDVAALATEYGLGLEAAGRKARYEFFEQERARLGADWILTAHHLGDLTEDVLLRLIRGAAWPALGGMPAVRGHILRPLLLTAKQDLQNLLQRQNLAWAEDESNLGLDFRRNRVRHKILPLITQENPAFAKQIRQLWQGSQQEAAYWQEMWGKYCHQRGQDLFLSRADLEELHPAARLKLYALSIKALGEANNGQALADNLQVLDEVFLSGQQKLVQFPGFIQARTVQSGVFFRLQTSEGNHA